jgi:glucose 1-dehydrogenase
MTSKLTDRVAVITGSDSGIGQGAALELAAEGADIVVTYLHDPDGAGETARAVEHAGRRALVVRLDVRDEGAVEALFDETVETFGRLDILINSAGQDASGTNVADIDIEAFDDSMRTNLYGPLLCCKHFLRCHRIAGHGRPGRIINITSVHEEIPRAGAADYDCAKGALRNLTRGLALEVAEAGITVNNIAPGMVLTPFNQDAIDDPKVLEEQVQSIPMKRAAEPSEVGRLAVFLASDDGAYVTGASYVIDGGLMQNQGQGA